MRTSLKREVGTQPVVEPWRAGSGIACGADEITMRALEPAWRASTKLPSMLSVWVTVIALGSETLISVSCVVAP